MRLTLAALAAAFSFQAQADEPWVFEFEFAYLLKNHTSRLALPSCDKVIPPKYVHAYARDPQPGFEISCGGNNPVYTHFLGRRCWKPLKNFVVECGWRHRSSPGTKDEISWDALSVRGRFSW